MPKKSWNLQNCFWMRESIRILSGVLIMQYLLLCGQFYQKMEWIFLSIIAYFQREYIKTGIFDKKYSKYVQSVFQIRNSCDYDDFFIASRQDAEEQYQKAEELYEEVKAFLEK